MSLPLNEPTTTKAVEEWIEKQTQSSDRFSYVAERYEQHRLQHGCIDVYPYTNGPLLGALLRRLPARGSCLRSDAAWATAGSGSPMGRALRGFSKRSSAMTGTRRSPGVTSSPRGLATASECSRGGEPLFWPVCRVPTT